MGTTLTYNGINLQFVKTKTLSEKPKYDDSGTDLLWITKTLRVQTIFTVLDDDTSIPAGVANANGPGQVMAELEHMLWQPRKPLNFEVDGDSVIAVLGGLDSNNGPKPTAVEVTQVTDRTFRIEWEVEVALGGCDEVVQKWASNRWEQEHAIDERGYSMFTTTGVVWVRSDMLINPDGLRGITPPPLHRDFRRTYDFRLQKDGLALHYRIHDTQEYLLPPKGCVKAEFKRGVETINGGAWTAVVKLGLEGFKGMPKKQLINTAVVMAIDGINSLRPIRDPRAGKKRFPYIRKARWSEDGFENKCEVSLEALIATEPRVFNISKNGLFEAGGDAFKGLLISSANVPLNTYFAIKEIMADPDILEEEKKRKIAELRAQEIRRIQAEQRGILRKPPFERLGEPGPMTAFGVDGIDPGIRGKEQFQAMVMAAFRDPCTRDDDKRQLRKGLNNNPIKQPGRLNQRPGVGGNDVPGGGGKIGQGLNEQEADIAENESTLRSFEGPSTSVLRSFTVVPDVLKFEQDNPTLTTDPFGGVYELWETTIDQDIMHHSDVLYPTVDGQNGVEVRTANPGSKVVVEWNCTKVGSAPEIPVVADDNLIPIRTKIRVHAVDVGGDGVSGIFSCSGCSEFKAKDISKIALRPAVAPWMAVEQNQLMPFIPKLIDLSTDSAGTSTLKSNVRP